MDSIRNYAWRVILVYGIIAFVPKLQIHAANHALLPVNFPVDTTSFQLDKIHVGEEPPRLVVRKSGTKLENIYCIEDAIPWQNLENNAFNDDEYINVKLLPGEMTSCLSVRDFDFNIPEGALINGIKIIVEGYINGGEKPGEIMIGVYGAEDQLLSINYSNKVSKGISWPQQLDEEEWKYGIIGEAWIEELDAAMVNDMELGLSLQVKNVDDLEVEIFIDQINLEVFYTPLFTLCMEDCGVAFVEPPGTDYNYHWILPQGMKITSEEENHHIINFIMTSSGYGVEEICVEVESPEGIKKSVCRNILFNNCAPGIIGNYVWLDEDGDGSQGVLEKGLKDIVIILNDAQGDPIDTTKTDSMGFYEFSEIVAGDYYIKCVPHDRLLPTKYRVMSDSTKDNDLLDKAGVFRTTIFYLEAGQAKMELDFGFVESASVGNYVWHDLNADGFQDDDEPGMEGLQLDLYRGGILLESTFTDEYGRYLFTGLYPGIHHICIVNPPSSYISPTISGNNVLNSDFNTIGCTEQFELHQGEELIDIDAGLYYKSSVGDFVWLDFDENGIQGIDENGIDSVIVLLYDASTDLFVQSTITDGEGFYLFDSLNPGNYYIKIENIGIFEATSLQTGQNTAFDSDMQLQNGEFYTVDFILSSGQNNFDIDAGFYFIKASVGNFLWLDSNQNGIQDADENGLNDIEIMLLTENDSVVELTSSHFGVDQKPGFYEFIDLQPGKYYIQIEIPDLYLLTTVINQSPELNSDINELNGPNTSYTFRLNPGDKKTDIDVGLIYNYGTIGDFIWVDVNENGVQDPGEPGINGVNAYLYDEFDNLIDSTITSYNLDAEPGYYSFENVIPGRYYLKINGLEEGYKIGIINAGNEQTDSDFYELADEIRSDLFELAPGAALLSMDAGFIYRNASISGVSWLDTDENGIRDADDSLRTGVEVKLFQSGGQLIQTKITDQNGEYIFSGLPAGEYYIAFALEDAYLFTIFGIGNENEDSDVSGLNGNGTTDIISLHFTENKLFVDAGYRHNYAQIGDYIWFDENANGMQDNGEEGLDGIDIKLYNESGDLVATKTSSTVVGKKGIYLFDKVIAGNYYLELMIPGEYMATVADFGDDDLDSDLIGINGPGTTDMITLSYGEKKATVDFGLLFKKGSIGDYIWRDRNKNGLQDADEDGMNGVSVSLFTASGVFIDSQVSDSNSGADGYYRFTEVNPGLYYLQIEGLAGFEPTLLNAGDSAIDSDLSGSEEPFKTLPFTLLPGEIIDHIDMGLIRQISHVGGLVWHDLDENGILDSTEPVLANIKVELFRETGELIQATISDQDGRYGFDDLEPGFYYISFEIPNEFEPTVYQAGSDISIDSDINSAFGYGTTHLFELQLGESNTGIYAGLIGKNYGIGDFVWLDENKNGIQDLGETGLNEVEIRLYDATGQWLKTTTSLPHPQSTKSGYYLFNNVPAGEYYIRFVIQTDFLISVAGAGSDPSRDSDITGTFGPGTTDKFYFDNVSDKLTIDAGIYPDTYSGVGDFVWEDLNGNGIQDPGEAGVNEVPINLYKLDGTFVTSSETGINPNTGFDGYFLFDNIPAGEYYIEIDLPQNYYLTLPKMGIDDALDSDITHFHGAYTSSTISLGVDHVDLNIDIGIYRLAKIGDYIWNDTNANGMQDVDESGLNNISIELFDQDNELVSSTVSTTNLTTGSDGFYSFESLDPGSYYVKFNIENEFTLFNSGDDELDSDVTGEFGFGTSSLVQLISGETNYSVDAGTSFEGGDINGYVWLDRNGNGILEDDEEGVLGIVVRLMKEDGSQASEIISYSNNNTGKAGYFEFINISVGKYYLAIEKPEEFNFSLANVGADDDKDSEIDHANGSGTSALFTIVDQQTIAYYNVGMFIPASIGDFVWFDENDNGLQDAGEPGASNVEIKLLKDGTTFLANTFTDSDGYYSFDNLKQGIYSLEFTALVEYGFTSRNMGTNDAIDSDVGTSGKSPLISLAHGAKFFDLDAGLVLLQNLVGNKIWLDINANGVQDVGEPGLEGLGIGILNEENEMVAYTESNPLGNYKFYNMQPGSYRLKVSKPDDQTFTKAFSGNDEALDNDVDKEGYSPWFEMGETTFIETLDIGLKGKNLLTTDDLLSKVGSEMYFYPNPVQRDLYFQTKDDRKTDYRISITTNNGALVFSKTFVNREGSNTEVIMLRNLPSGIYNFSLYKNGKLFRQEQIYKLEE